MRVRDSIALRLHIKLHRVSGAIRGRDNPSLKPQRVVQVDAQRFQIANMVQRETHLPSPRRCYAGKNHAGQTKETAEPVPALRSRMSPIRMQVAR